VQKGEGRLAQMRLMLLTAHENWDDDGASIVPMGNWERAWEIKNLVSYLLPTIDRPTMSPCPDGSVHLRWLGPNMRWIEVEIHSTETWYTKRTDAGTFSSGQVILADLPTMIRTAVA
jgi:hypothetical protein